ncbi:hypothetical protein [Micrococcus terreus]|uniref:hypothetical protein n=1 Tax=Micrococcus terreus TaxID=574650 RepID=UPI0011605775|nr:hypothetical protein [Micrococcus terreus]
MNVVIPRNFYSQLFRSAAERHGQIIASAHDAEVDDFSPGSGFADFLCNLWRVREADAEMAFHDYVVALQDTCEQRGVTPPTPEEIAAGQSQEINRHYYPDIDVEALLSRLKQVARACLPYR